MALLDTGASISVINTEVKEFLAKHGISTQAISKSIGLVTGSCHSSESVKMQIEWQEETLDMDFIVLGEMTQSVILGRDFLYKSGITIDIKNGMWYHENSTVGNSFVQKSKANLISQVQEILFMFPNETILLSMDIDGKNNSEITINELIDKLDLSSQNLDSIKDILIKYKSIFSEKPGRFGNYKFTIDTGDSRPIKCAPRPMTAAKRDILGCLLQKMIDEELVEKAHGPWSFNPVIVSKKNGKFRLCVDYRPLNKVTIPDNYCMPRIDDILACLAKAKYISVFDLSAGFHHLEIVHHDRAKTAFNTPWGLWQFTRMPFGVINGPGKFQRALDDILGDFKWQFVIAYVDDLIVYSETLEDHIVHLQKLFERLHASNVKLNPSKVQFFKNKVSFLGFIIENGECSPDPEKLKSLEGYGIPVNRKDVQRFLGFAGYYRQFIENFSLIAKPLTNLLKKEVEFIWSDQCQAAFDKLRIALIKAQSLHLPDLNKPFVVQTDASDKGLGCALLQSIEGILCPIYFASRTLSPPEQNYSTTEKECLAIIYAIRKFRPYLEYSHFIIQTDHQALSWLKNLKEPVGRLARWALELQGYNFEVQYKPGRLNKTADALSRSQPDAVIHAIFLNPSVTMEDIIKAQQSDLLVCNIYKFIKSSELPSNNKQASESIIKHAKDCFISDKGCIFKYIGPYEKPWENDERNWRIWLPDSLVETIVKYFHDDLPGCHLGVHKTYKKVAERFWWPKMRKHTVRYVLSCHICQSVKARRSAPQGIGTSPTVKAPWETITIDLIGPYVRTGNLNVQCLVVVDLFSKWVELFPIRKATSQVIIARIKEVACRWGFPRHILTDNGPQFTSSLFKNWCKDVGIVPLFIAPYHPNANPTERYNQTIKSLIVSTISQCKDWDRNLHEITFALRTSINESTQFTPAYINTGREFRNPLDNLMELSESFPASLSEFKLRFSYIYSFVKANLIKSQEKYLAEYNKKRRRVVFEIGDLVWRKTRELSDKSKKITASLFPKYCGPYKVIGKIKSDTYKLVHTKSGLEDKTIVAHVNDLKPCITFPVLDNERDNGKGGSNGGMQARGQAEKCQTVS